MTIKKTDKGWYVDIWPSGRSGKRYRKTLPTKGEAIRWKAWVIQQVTQTPDWEPPRKDQKHLSDCISIWFESHGQHLKDGKGRLQILNKICAELGDPVAAELTPEQYTQYRAARASQVTSNTLNHDLAYLKAVYNELVKQGQLKSNPLIHIKRIKLDEHELTFLTKNQIQILIKHLKTRRNQDALLIAKLCLATGARWSEAEQITNQQIRPYSVTYTGTKSGRNRTIPITEKLHSEIVNNSSNDRTFTNSYDAFTNALIESGIKLPKGQRTHVLRHTFASHFIMNGGNILTLQKILGHGSINMTMRYAHLAPDHLNEAKTFNPLSSLNSVDNL